MWCQSQGCATKKQLPLDVLARLYAEDRNSASQLSTTSDTENTTGSGSGSGSRSGSGSGSGTFAKSSSEVSKLSDASVSAETDREWDAIMQSDS